MACRISTAAEFDMIMTSSAWIPPGGVPQVSRLGIHVVQLVACKASTRWLPQVGGVVQVPADSYSQWDVLLRVLPSVE